MPSRTTAIARVDAAGSNFGDIHAPPSRMTFAGVICASAEYRAFAASPPTAVHSRPADARPPPSDCIDAVTGMISTPANTATGITRRL